MDLDEIKETIEESISATIRKHAEFKGIKKKVLLYESYSNSKERWLPGNYRSLSAPDLDWLYDPDSGKDMLRLHPTWGSEYHFVVILTGDNEESLSNLASLILDTHKFVGLVCFHK